MVDLSELLRKRITKEINVGNHHDWILFNYDKTKKPFLFVPIKLYPSLQNTASAVGRDPALVVSFPRNWPWGPPTVTYYDKDIQELYRAGQLFANDILKLSDIGCLCCGSILCRDRWSINRKIQDIVEEFVKITSWRARVVERFLCKRIQENKIGRLPVNDYPIFEYL